MAGEGFKRKLAAILSADVEGYSLLMDDDEQATVRTLMGREREAQEAALKDLSIDPDFSVNEVEKASPNKERERVKRRCDAARKAGLPD